MADSQPFKSESVYDRVDTFERGMNSGLDPLLIQKNQLAFSLNGTVRDGFITTRPSFTNRLTIAYPSDEVQTAIEQGIFQGAGYYQPDSGDQSLFAQIGGRLFQFVIIGSGVTVIERTIPGDPNPASATQVWMWQSENYLIVTNGSNLPIFFDGISSRRSRGPSVSVAQVGAVAPTVPDQIGAVFPIDMTVPFTGEFDVPVLINGEYFQPIENVDGYLVNAVNIYATPSGAIPLNTPVQIIPSIAFVVAVAANPTGNFFPPNFGGNFINLTLSMPYSGAVGDYVTLFGKKFYVSTIGPGNAIRLLAFETGTYSPIAAGTRVYFFNPTQPTVQVALISEAATAPNYAATVQLKLSAAFSGTPGQVVYIGAGQYSITAVASTPPGTTVQMVNLSNTSSTFTIPASSDVISVPELPIGRMGAYGLGQNWMCLTDGLSFICSDTSRGPSGTQANSYRDAVLKTTDLTFSGGNFAIPGAGNIITSMTFTANLDLALGQGSLQVGTAAFMASCVAPISFADLFANYPTGPILTFSLLGTGPMGQNSTIPVNSDIYFRSNVGFGTLVQARRDFSSPGNTPISDEMLRVITGDDKTLLAYGSAINFDNRWIITLAPQNSSQGVIHSGLSVSNLDPVSGMADKNPPVYDGLWTGMNVLQMVSGSFNGTKRAFAFTFNVALSKIELYELLPTGSQFFDNGSVPITWSFETAALFRDDVKPRNVMVSLRDGEFAVTDLRGLVRFEVYYKSDQSCWIPWHSFSICASADSPAQYFPKLGLGEPSAANCDPVLNTPTRDGYTFQVKFVITGYCRFLRARFSAVTIPTPKFQPPICDVVVEV